MTTRNRFGGVTVLGAILTLGLTLGVLEGAALADTKVPAGTQQPAAGPAAGTQLKVNKPGVQPDLYCTHNTANSNLSPCDRDFKQKCTRAGGKVKDPSGNPDYGVCVHDDLW